MCLGIIDSIVAFGIDNFKRMQNTFLLTVDSSLGRVNYESLPDQTLMEMLIDGVVEADKCMFQDADKNIADVCEWDIVKCADERVEKVNLEDVSFDKKDFPFQYIPPLVVSFKARSTNLCGTLDTDVLPRGLTVLRVSENELHGTLRFKTLPRKLKKMNIALNKFEGSLQLSDLPATMTKLYAGANKFSGEVCLNELPFRMKELNICNNKLTGSVSIERLPENMRLIDLSENAFSGKFRMLTFPDILYEVSIGRNDFDQEVVLAKTYHTMLFDLKADFITSVVDENGDEHEWGARILNSQKQYRR